ncbi:MAG: glycosyltransferase, partial [Chitinophagaceae bacterium]
AKISQLAASMSVNLNLTGKLTKEEWTALSLEYDVFINTTRFDNMPISVIEALALGMPVVSTDVGGIPFLLTNENTALLVKDGDDQAMITAVKRLLSTPELVIKLGENGRNLVNEFDFEHVKERWFHILGGSNNRDLQ